MKIKSITLVIDFLFGAVVLLNNINYLSFGIIHEGKFIIAFVILKITVLCFTSIIMYFRNGSNSCFFSDWKWLLFIVILAWSSRKKLSYLFIFHNFFFFKFLFRTFKLIYRKMIKDVKSLLMGQDSDLYHFRIFFILI